MRKDIAMEWADMLESGIIKQGKNSLENKGKYCCLGALCRILEKRVNIDVDDIDSSNVCFNGEYAYLPKEVINYTGMKSDDGEFTVNDSTYRLSSLNDGGKSFKEIAQIIRENYKQL
jgi:hypothetical protein